ncbi:MAG: histidine kinase, partial [Propionibacteriaceae bacterium]|nr:histidine kinase [Propionibacteriaceae bacterium]
MEQEPWALRLSASVQRGLHVLRQTAVGGSSVAGPAWAAFPPQRPHQRVKVALWVVVLALALAGFWVNLALWSSDDVPVMASLIAALLMVVPLVWLQRSPLVVWRWQTVGFLLFAFMVQPERTWAWPIPALLLYGLVLFLVAAGQTATITLGSLALSVATLVLVGRDSPGVVLLSLAAAVGATTWAGLMTGQRQNARSQLEADQAARAVLAERTRIARELHDAVGHHMSMIAIQAQAAPLRLPGLSDEGKAIFGLIERTAREALTETRQIVGLLRGDQEAERAPAVSLDQIPGLVESVRAGGVDVSLTWQPPSDPVPLAAGQAVYRVVQEALANSARHAPGSAVAV